MHSTLIIINPNDIDRVNVLKGRDALIKYGDNAKNGAIEITTKNAKQKDRPINVTADTIMFRNQHLKIIGGSVTMNGKESVISGDMNFPQARTKMPLIVLNGKVVTDIGSFKMINARFRLFSLNAKQGIAKYGDKAKYGALEINRL